MMYTNKERKYGMIDFKNASFFKLKPVTNAPFMDMVSALLLREEKILGIFQGMRDGVVFTNMRIISVNVQGVTGKKKDFTSMPYSKIQLFSVETAGVLDMDTELELWFSGAGKVKFEFTSSTDVGTIAKVIAQYALR